MLDCIYILCLMLDWLCRGDKIHYSFLLEGGPPYESKYEKTDYFLIFKYKR